MHPALPSPADTPAPTDSPSATRAIALVALVACLVFLVGLGNHVLWDYHEPYVGGIIQEMSARGEWIVPTLNGRPYLEKAPLFYLMGRLVCQGAGTLDPWALRLPSAIMAIATSAGVAWLGCRVQSARAGVWAGLLTATSVLFLQMGHRAVVDMTFTAAVTLSLGLAFLALREPARRVWVDLFWASVGITFLAKGVIGPVMVVWPVAVVLLLERERMRAFLTPGWGMGAGLALVLAWAVPLGLKGGRAALGEVFLRNTLGRFIKHPGLVPATGTLDEHREPLFFYLARTPGNVLPWLPLWATALVAGTRRRGTWLPVFFWADLALLSLSSGKRMVYLLPARPVSFLHTGLWLDARLQSDPGRAARWALNASVFLAVLLGAGLPWFVVARAGMAAEAAVVMMIPALTLGWAALREVARKRHARAMGWSLAQWVVTLLAFLVLAVPELDREWKPLLEPYRVARELEGQGAQVAQGRLTETQLGFVNLVIGHGLASAGTPEAVRAALAAPAPVVLLLEPKKFWKGELGGRLDGALELPTEASASHRLWDRTPVLVLNVHAATLLSVSDARRRLEDPEQGDEPVERAHAGQGAVQTHAKVHPDRREPPEARQVPGHS